MTKGASGWSIGGERVIRLVLYWDRFSRLLTLDPEQLRQGFRIRSEPGIQYSNK